MNLKNHQLNLNCKINSSCFSLCEVRCRLGENGASRQEGLKALPDGLLDILEALYIWHFYTIFGVF